nr:MAG TPA: Protein of unknown function (DUF4059) [Caudoviricetes sp.]
MISNLIVLHAILLIFLVPIWLYYFKVTKKDTSCDVKRDRLYAILWSAFVILIYALGMMLTFI